MTVYPPTSQIRPKVITQPIEEPISLSEAKEHLRVTVDDEDTLIYSYIAAARDCIETRCGRTFHQTTYELTFDRWPHGDRLYLLRATPLISVDFIKYKDSSGVETTWDSTSYEIDTYGEPGFITPAYNETWPSLTDLHPVNPIKVRYTAGIQTSSPTTPVPPSIKIATFFLVAALFENREPEIAERYIESVALTLGLDTYLTPHIVDYES